MVKTIDATTTDRLRRSPLYLDLSPSCARKRACMELTTICRFQRLLNPSFRLFQCSRSVASLPCKIVFGRFDAAFYQEIMLSSGVFRRETASGFYPWCKVDSPRKRVAEGLCGWRHGNSFPMSQSAQHSRTAKCEAFHFAPRLFFVFLFLIPFTIR